MKSNFTLAGHPVHPMLVSFPIAFYVATAVGYCAYGLKPDPFWFRLACYSNIAGVVTAIIAAVPGFVDWYSAVPKYSPAKRTGMIHMAFNTAALVLFAADLWIQYGKLNSPQPVMGSTAVVLSVLGVISTLAVGFFGWKMVQRHHLGVDLTTSQLQLEPSHPDLVFSEPRKRAASELDF